MEDFMTRANALKGFLNTDSGAFLKMGIAVIRLSLIHI